MHVCYITNEYPPAVHGGIGSFVRTLGRALVKRGVTVSVIGIYDELSGVSEDEGVVVYRARKPRLRGIRLLAGALNTRRMLAAAARRAPIDVLEGSEEGFLLTGRYPAARIMRLHGGYLYLATELGLTPQFWPAFKEKQSLLCATHYCAVSSYIARRTRALYKLDGQEIKVMPNPVDTALFSPQPGVEIEKGLIIFCGTLKPLKGVKELIRAMEYVTNTVADARLELYGADTCTESGRSYKASLEASINPGIRDRIRFCGYVDHQRLPSILARAEVCVYPSLIEAHPIAWLEGLAMGKAVVASRYGPGPEVIEHGVNGLLCDPRDPQSLAAAIIEVLSKPELRLRLEREARRSAVQRYSLDALAEENLRYYQRCAEELRAGR